MLQSKILIVDDVKYIRSVIRKVFEHMGFKIIEEAGSFEEARGKLNSFTPDFVTVDIDIPSHVRDNNGITLLKNINQNFPNMRSIVISACTNPALVKESVTSGAETFIAKPFRVESLMDAIKKVFEGRQNSEPAEPEPEPEVVIREDKAKDYEYVVEFTYIEEELKEVILTLKHQNGYTSKRELVAPPKDKIEYMIDLLKSRMAVDFEKTFNQKLEAE